MTREFPCSAADALWPEKALAREVTDHLKANKRLIRAEDAAAGMLDAVAKVYGIRVARKAAQAWLDDTAEMGRPPGTAATRLKALQLATFAELHQQITGTRNVKAAAQRYYELHGGHSAPAVYKAMDRALKAHADLDDKKP